MGRKKLNTKGAIEFCESLREEYPIDTEGLNDIISLLQREEPEETIKDKNKRVIKYLEKIMYKTTETDPEEKNMPIYQHNFNDWMRGLIREIKEGKMRCQM